MGNAKSKTESFRELTWKKCITVGDMRRFLMALPASTPLFMQSDEEGNSIHKILTIELYTEGAFLVPWEGNEGTFNEVARRGGIRC